VPDAVPLLQLDRVSRSFGGERRLLRARRPVLRAVEAVSLSVARGEVVGLVGESGSGKSTIGRMAVRLLAPSAGRVLVAGTDLATLSRRDLRRQRRRVQMVFQDPYASLNPNLTVGAALREAMGVHGIGADAAERGRRVSELLEAVGLRRNLAERYPHEFSGGQRQRIGIARALAVEPDMIVADEPVAALDVSVQAQILNLLQDLQRRLGLALLFIAHDLAVVQHIAERVVVLYLGRIMEAGPTEALFQAPRHPYTRALLSAIPVPDPDRQATRIVLSGEIPSPLDPPSGCVFRTRCPSAIAACAEAVPPLRAVTATHSVACIRDDLS
jgi:oligopeptide/dipeptide ABC transporter ATP-binding protein